jgi:hypothetical protein
MADPRQAAVERAIRAAAMAILARDQTVAEIVAKLTDAVAGIAPADFSPREGIAAVRQSRRKAMLAELEALTQRGRGRAAPMLLARKFAADPHDSVEVTSLARKLRRWRNEKFGRCPLPGENIG